ncbi:unnamed protein product [Pseudo-nitzschia multistriata]|uniref:Uncharacterized protein n=1 Tax=Pseudo-nitzschia multistriata TaxID=183589 RepID=A0A448ZKS8_9STRA|nr:unnamed protein product [Pseudo-nitzschia multistriata]
MKFSINILTQVLCVIGSLSHASEAQKLRDDVHFLMYETDGALGGQHNSPLHFFTERSKVANVKATVYGNDLEYRGFGDKYQTLRPILEIVDDDTLIILADARDVALNVPEDEDLAVAAVDHFIQSFKRLTERSPNAVVLSAEAQCCVSAMSHASPRDYFDPVTGKRNRRACSSGLEAKCRWSENRNIHEWVSFMHQRRFKETGLQGHGDVYLNAGLMAGYPRDLINLMDIMDIAPYEDDQAVLTGLMYRYPEAIVLDYGQEMFGNSQWTRGPVDGCVFEGQGSHAPLTHIDTHTQPLLIHTPGKLYACLDMIIESLGGSSQQRYHSTHRKLLTGRLSLAAQLGFGGAGGAASYSDKVDNEEINEEVDEIVEETETEIEELGNYGYGTANYEQYGQFGDSNYGQYGVASEDNYGQYGIASDANYGQYGVASEANYGQYGIATEANYGVVSEANYGSDARRVRRRRTSLVRGA